MFKVHDVVIDFSDVPAAVRAAETVIDNLLTPPWLSTELYREMTVIWASLGGITIPRAQGLVRLLDLYRKVGRWRVTIESTSDAQWVIRFDRSNDNG